uniref:Uncharacterized protein n=1 Tax=Trichobilharzia regenti TaxID=157069 RepID=A0AA85JSJ0_TRIRE|nr:unnamed protein product [Trichobilharzia regenti]
MTKLNNIQQTELLMQLIRSYGSNRNIIAFEGENIMSRYIRTYQMSINLLSLIFWCIFSNNFVNTVNTSKSAGLLQKHWLKDVDDDELRQMIEDANITEEQLNDPDQTSDIFQRLIFLSPKNLRRFMQVLREWDNLSQRIRYGR